MSIGFESPQSKLPGLNHSSAIHTAKAGNISSLIRYKEMHLHRPPGKQWDSHEVLHETHETPLGFRSIIKCMVWFLSAQSLWRPDAFQFLAITFQSLQHPENECIHPKSHSIQCWSWKTASPWEAKIWAHFPRVLDKAAWIHLHFIADAFPKQGKSVACI